MVCSASNDETMAKNLNVPQIEEPVTAGFAVLPTLLQPYSRGEIRLASASPFENPIVDPRYLSDRQCVRACVRACVPRAA